LGRKRKTQHKTAISDVIYNDALAVVDYPDVLKNQHENHCNLCSERWSWVISHLPERLLSWNLLDHYPLQKDHKKNTFMT